MKRPQTLTRAQENRLLLGLAVQPFVAAALAFALFPVVDYTGRLLYGGGRTVDPVESAVGFGIIAGVVASVACGLAYPSILWLLERGPLTRAKTMVAGFVFGNLPAALIVLLLAARHVSAGVAPTLANTTYGAVGAFRVVALGSVMGLVGASVFWWVAGRHLNREHN